MNFYAIALWDDIKMNIDRLCARINPPMPDEIQAKMLRYVWHMRPRLRLLNSPDDARREMDRIARLWRPSSIFLTPETFEIRAEDWPWNRENPYSFVTPKLSNFDDVQQHEIDRINRLYASKSDAEKMIRFVQRGMK